MHPQPTLTGPETQTERLLQVCRELTDHLSAYAISADNFDDEAFAACDKAERLLMDARTAPQKVMLLIRAVTEMRNRTESLDYEDDDDEGRMAEMELALDDIRDIGYRALKQL